MSRQAFEQAVDETFGKHFLTKHQKQILAERVDKLSKPGSNVLDLQINTLREALGSGRVHPNGENQIRERVATLKKHPNNPPPAPGTAVPPKDDSLPPLDFGKTPRINITLEDLPINQVQKEAFEKSGHDTNNSGGNNVAGVGNGASAEVAGAANSANRGPAGPGANNATGAGV